MKGNMHVIDRIVRLLIAAAIGVLYFTHKIHGTLAIILGVIAVIFLVTSIFGWCFIYALLGISTRKKEKA